MNEINWMQQGWECPKCGAVMAPHVSCCVNCRGNQGGGVVTTVTNPMTAKNPIFNEPSSICGYKQDAEEQYCLKI